MEPSYIILIITISIVLVGAVIGSIKSNNASNPTKIKNHSNPENILKSSEKSATEATPLSDCKPMDDGANNYSNSQISEQEFRQDVRIIKQWIMFFGIVTIISIIIWLLTLAMSQL